MSAAVGVQSFKQSSEAHHFVGLGRDVAADIQPMVRCQPLSDLDSMAALLSSQNKFANLKSI